MAEALRLERVRTTHPDAVLLIEDVQAIYVERYGGPDASPFAAADFEPPYGMLFVGYDGDRPVATGAWRHVGLERLGSTRTAEVKRMYVVPSHQRRGLARAMLAHLEATAQAAGHDVMVLNTGGAQPEAIALYESSGYEPVDGWGTYACTPGAFFYAKRLGG